MYSLDKLIVISYRSGVAQLSQFLLPRNILRDQTELLKYETVSIKYYECLSVSYPANAKRLFSEQHYIFTRGLPCSTIFSTLAHKRYDFQGGKTTTERKMCFNFLYKFGLKHLSL